MYVAPFLRASVDSAVAVGSALFIAQEAPSGFPVGFPLELGVAAGALRCCLGKHFSGTSSCDPRSQLSILIP